MSLTRAEQADSDEDEGPRLDPTFTNSRPKWYAIKYQIQMNIFKNKEKNKYLRYTSAYNIIHEMLQYLQVLIHITLFIFTSYT